MFKKAADGQYYYFGKGDRPVHIIKSHPHNLGVFCLGSKTAAITPPELIGKRVRIKLEFVGEKR